MNKKYCGQKMFTLIVGFFTENICAKLFPL